jgi:hypothetical protein
VEGFLLGFGLAMFFMLAARAFRSEQPPQVIYIQAEPQQSGGTGWLVLLLIAIVVIVILLGQ